MSIIDYILNTGMAVAEKITEKAEKLTYEGKLATKIENLSEGKLKTELNEIHLPPVGFLERHMYAKVVYIESKEGKKYVLVPDWIPKDKDHYVALGTKGHEKVLFTYQTNLDELAKEIVKTLLE